VVWPGPQARNAGRVFGHGVERHAAGPIMAACVDMWEPYTASILSWVPGCRIVYDKFHVMQHASKAVDEVRRAEFFRKGGRLRGLVKGKRWLLLR
jgi:transposase